MKRLLRYQIYLLPALLLFCVALYGQDISYTSLHTGTTFDARSINVTLPVGSLGANPGVTGTGAAAYSVPIAVPPGTNGIVPDISIDYNSQNPSGILGMGWNISGLSRISRVPKNKYFDSYANPVEVNANDRFSLDGQRMILKSGTYGSDGATYGAEAENFSTITSYGSGANAWFKLVTKEGVVMEFGNSEDSKRIADGGTQILFWVLNRIQYPEGNYIEFKYTNYNNYHRIDEVNYTGNTVTNQLPYNKVKFDYKFRSDKSLIVEAGNYQWDAYLLDKVTVTAEGVVSKSYQFNYASDNINSYLKEVVEIGSDNSTLNSTIFKYGDAPVEFEAATSGIVAGQSVDLIPGDFDADGFTDILAASYQYVNYIKYHTGFKVYKRTAASSSYTSSSNIALPSSTNYTILEKKNSSLSYNFLTGDFTGDGSDDILTTNTSISGSNRLLNSFLLYKSDNNGTTFTTTTIPTYTGYNRIHSNGHFVFPGDFDGDGVQDIMTILGTSGDSYYSHLYFGNNSSSFGTVGTTGTVNFAVSTWATMDKIQVLDFNGDGKSDLMLIKDDTCEILTFDAWSARRIYFSTNFLSKNHLIYLGDFNGDGRTDILTRNSLTNNAGIWTQAMSTGTIFLQSPISFQHTPDITGAYSDDHFTISDYNNDGKMDIYHGWNYFVGGVANSSRLDLYYSTGAYGFYHVQHSFSSTLGFVGNQVFDLNGDGRSDNVNITYYGSPFDIFSFKKDGTENLLSKVKSGFNHVSQWSYKKLPDAGTFYIRGALTAHPTNNVQPAFYCVNEYKSQDGVGGVSTIQYAYEEAKLSKTGKGFMGFRKFTANNLATGIKTVSENEFDLTFFTSALYRTSTYLSSTSALLGQTTFTNQFVNLGSGRFWYRVNSVAENKAFEGRAFNTTNTWDNYGNVTVSTVVTQQGSATIETKTTTTVFDDFVTTIPNRPISITISNTRTGQSAASATTSYGYNGFGQLVSKTDFSGLPKNVVYAYEYFPLGNLKKTTVTPASMTARSTSSTYDSKGRFAVTNTDELSQISSATYDSKWGKPLTQTGTDGLTTTFEYDGYGRPKKATSPEGVVVNYSLGWDISGTSLWYSLESNPGRPDTKTWFDVLGRNVKGQTQAFPVGEWTTETRTYDSRGNIATFSNAAKSGEAVLTSSNVYDAYNRLTSTGNSTFGYTTTAYSYFQGNLTTTTTNPANQQSSKVMDASGRLLSATDNAGTLTYVYNSQGNVLTVKAGNSVITTSEYDSYGKVTKLIDASAGTTTYNYNSLGQLISQTNANGHTHTKIYDLLGRNTSRTGPEGTATYEYFPVGTGSLAASTGKIKKVTGFSGNLEEYTYDSFGRVTSLKETVDGSAHTTSYGYNTYGDVVTTTYPSGFGVNNNYDANGFLLTIKNSANTVTLYTNTGMNGLGQNTTYTLGNAKNTVRTYNHGMPLKFQTTSVHDLEFTWDYNSGNLSKRKDIIKGKEENFTYDNLNRLLSATVTGLPAQTMTYNYAGGITTKTDVGTYTYNLTNQNAVESVDNTSAVIPTLTQNVSYTAFMQPNVVTETSSGQPFELTYTYGDDYQRIKSVTKQSGNTINTRYYFKGGYEKDVTGAVTRYIQYIVAPAGLVSIVVNEGAAAPAYYYTYSDHLGSILRVTDNAGGIVAEQEFDAWGRRRNASTWVALAPTDATGLPVWLVRGFTNHEHLDKFGLINMNGRLYDPVLARMLSPDNNVVDPSFSQDYNRYSYARNNPLIHIDPDGEWVFLIPQISFGKGGFSLGLEVGVGVPGVLSASVTGGYNFKYDKGYWSVQGALVGLYAGYGSSGAFFGVGYRYAGFSAGVGYGSGGFNAGISYGGSAGNFNGAIGIGWSEKGGFDWSASGGYTHNIVADKRGAPGMQAADNLTASLEGGPDDELMNTPGGKWDKYGEGFVPYHGDAVGGTNFIGPGPDYDPYTLFDPKRLPNLVVLTPVDQIDAAAQEHDYAYWKAATGGIPGALFNKKVTIADAMLVMKAAKIMRQYKPGGTQISPRTYNLARGVFAVFTPITFSKGLRILKGRP